MKFAKQPTSYQEQAALLVSRGMLVVDHNEMLRQLEAVGYYRLCSYWHPFKLQDDSFKSGTSFEEVWRRYVFDRHLRLAVMDAIERVEVAVRSALITDLAMRFGCFAHTHRANFPTSHPEKHQKFLEEVRAEALRSKERFVEHFKATYDEFPDLPIWAMAETMTFGQMLTLFKMSERRIQSSVARRYEIAGPVLLSWLQTLNYVRNICAHHSRLWNRELALKPMIPDPRNAPRWHTPGAVPNNRVFVVLTLLQDLLRTIAPQSRWRFRLFETFERFPGIPLAQMGMNPSWQSQTIWL